MHNALKNAYGLLLPTEGDLVAMPNDRKFETAKFLLVKNKAHKDAPFICLQRPPRNPWLASAGSHCVAKLQIIF